MPKPDNDAALLDKFIQENIGHVEQYRDEIIVLLWTHLVLNNDYYPFHTWPRIKDKPVAHLHGILGDAYAKARARLDPEVYRALTDYMMAFRESRTIIPDRNNEPLRMKMWDLVVKEIFIKVAQTVKVFL